MGQPPTVSIAPLWQVGVGICVAHVLKDRLVPGRVAGCGLSPLLVLVEVLLSTAVGAAGSMGPWCNCRI